MSESNVLSITQLSYRDRFEGLGGDPLNVTMALRFTRQPHELIESALKQAALQSDMLQSVFTGESLRMTPSKIALPKFVRDASDHDKQELIDQQINRLPRLGEELWSAIHFQDSDSSLLCMAFHHMAFDGLSRPALLDLLSSQTTAGKPYRDFALWQRSEFDDPGRARHVAFWSREMRGLDHNQHTRLSFAKNVDEDLDTQAEEVTVTLSNRAFRNTVQRSKRLRASIFTLILTALSHVVLDSIEDDAAVLRVTFHGRPPGFERSIGAFAHDVVLPIRRSSRQRFDLDVARTLKRWNGLGEFLFTPYSVVREAAGKSQLPYRPIVITLNAMRLAETVQVFGSKGSSSAPAIRQREDGLHIALVQQTGYVSLVCSFSPHRFDADDVKAFLTRICQLVGAGN